MLVFMIEIPIKTNKGKNCSQLEWTNHLCQKLNYFFYYND